MSTNHSPLILTFVKFSKSFLLAYSIRNGISLFYNILRRKLQFSFLNQDAIKIGLFFGSFTSLNHLFMKILDGINGKLSKEFVSGALSASSIMFLPKDNHRIISVYLFTQLLQAMYNSNIESIPEVFKMHGNALLFAFSSAEVLYSWVMEPQTLPKSYLDFITYMGTIDQSILDGVRNMHLGHPIDHQKIKRFCEKYNNVPVINQSYPWSIH